MRGGSSDGTNLSLLLDSLLCLGHYYTCLQTAVVAAMELLRNCQLGNELWVTATGNVFRVVWACLGCDQGHEEVRGRRDARLLRRLGVCLFKAMDLAYDMYDVDCSLSLPVGVIWTLFHTLIARSVRTLLGGRACC